MMRIDLRRPRFGSPKSAECCVIFRHLDTESKLHSTPTIAARYLFVWLLLAFVATLNGIVRQSTYGKILPELTAHQVSTVTAILASGAVVWAIHRLWPIQSVSQSWVIGISWLVLTVAFEFGFGHYVAGHSWEKLLADYNLVNGRVWSLFLAWVTVLPFVVYTVTK